MRGMRTVLGMRIRRIPPHAEISGGGTTEATLNILNPLNTACKQSEKAKTPLTLQKRERKAQWAFAKVLEAHRAHLPRRAEVAAVLQSDQADAGEKAARIRELREQVRSSTSAVQEASIPSAASCTDLQLLRGREDQQCFDYEVDRDSKSRIRDYIHR